MKAIEIKKRLENELIGICLIDFSYSEEILSESMKSSILATHCILCNLRSIDFTLLLRINIYNSLNY